MAGAVGRSRTQIPNAHPLMSTSSPPQPSTDRFRRIVLQVVIATSLLATLLAWYFETIRGISSPIWTTVQAVTAAVLSLLLAITSFKLLPQRVVELGCLVCIACVCAACMALGMYVYGQDAGQYLQPLYLWIPLVYVFAFMLVSHRAGLILSLLIFALFLGISLPYLLHDLHGRYVNFTVQLHIASAVMIAMPYFFSSYQHRLRLAEVAVGKLAQMSTTDELTQLPNRRHMSALLERNLADFKQGGSSFAIILFDIDRFKSINDEFGHATGDAALVALAARAAEVFRGVGELGRWGGDEFVAWVRNIGPGDASRMAGALCAHVAAEPMRGGRLLTISCGVTAASVDDNIDSLLQRADAALYAAKHAGRNRVESIATAHRSEAAAAT
jgi:diguanylate cyclase (GGDEF)-like protein